MLVTMTALGITSYMSIDYSSETLKERGGELLHGESDIRGESLRLLFETRIEQNKILANDPMIRLLVSEMDNRDFGTPDGIFDSGRFLPGESWSYQFEESGRFSYFCIIHPWMDGMIVVEEAILDYPHDATGKEIQFPILQYTPDRAIEVDLSWDPPVVRTHEKIQFVYQFYDPQTKSDVAEMKYNFVTFQNGQEIFRDEGLSQIGGDYRNFVFSNSGSIIVRIEGIQTPSLLAEESVTVFGDVQNKEQRSVDFTTAVYDNPEKTSHEEYHIKPAQRLTTYYELMIFIILIPAVMFIVALLWLKRKPNISETKTGAVKI